VTVIEPAVDEHSATPMPEPLPEPAPPAPDPEPPTPEPGEPTPQLRSVPEPEPEPEPEPQPEPEPEPEIPRLPRANGEPREWNIWELERIARDRESTDQVHAEELTFLLLELRQFANAEGELSVTFDPVVRESFGDLLYTTA
jgi:hypothetical protein